MAGAKLKPVEKKKEESKIDTRSDLLDQIRKGRKLRKVEKLDQQKQMKVRFVQRMTINAPHDHQLQ